MKFQRKYNKILNQNSNYIEFEICSKGKLFSVFIDCSHANLLIESYWSLTSRGYAYSARRVGPKLLHKVINNSKTVDHINGNKLDNRTCNLRSCTLSENSRNKSVNSLGKIYSKHKGVTSSYYATKPFRASLFFEGKRISLGFFKTEKEAAIAYNQAASKYFGEFARLNVVED